MRTDEAQYWNEVAREWEKTRPETLWRMHSDAVNEHLLTRWFPSGLLTNALKTDLFDEAFSVGLYPFLRARVQNVVGIDLVLLTARAARSRHPELQAVQADVRRLPFADGVFDLVISNSTLDHFSSHQEIVRALHEIRRVLREGGQLLITLDNTSNPVVALRNRLPFRLLKRLGILPYYMGASYGLRRLRQVLGQTRFQVLETTAVLHCPRVLAVLVARCLGKRASKATQERFLRLLWTFERLACWPTRSVTGYFVAVKAVTCLAVGKGGY